jgi:hypothetical protein
MKNVKWIVVRAAVVVCAGVALGLASSARAEFEVRLGPAGSTIGGCPGGPFRLQFRGAVPQNLVFGPSGHETYSLDGDPLESEDTWYQATVDDAIQGGNPGQLAALTESTRIAFLVIPQWCIAQAQPQPAQAYFWDQQHAICSGAWPGDLYWFNSLSPPIQAEYMAFSACVEEHGVSIGGQVRVLNLKLGGANRVSLLVMVVDLAGDMDCDGFVNNSDIAPFVLALTDPDAYATQYPSCHQTNADMNNDHKVDGRDIQGFVAVVLASALPDLDGDGIPDISDSDIDGDGVPNESDVCPTNRPDLPVDCNGRPLRDCNLDCNVDEMDLPCIMAEVNGG